MITITNPQDCCGCTACAATCPAGAIQMVANAKGFLAPAVDAEKCTQCGACEEVCPLRTTRDAKADSVRSAYALRLKDKEALAHSSSGGAFFALAGPVIAQGGVVFGAAYDKHLAVKHTSAETLDDCEQFQGSKYSQSDLTGVFPQVEEQLKQGRMVLFTGTPCQCHGLLRYLGKPYENLLTADLICHSVPSPRVFNDYKAMIEARFRERIIHIAMRDKTLGWGTTESYRYRFQSGREELNPKGYLGWQHIYESGLITRESCFACPYTNLNRVTDFTIGDFWDIRGLRPELKSREGTSVLLVSSAKGEALLDRIAQAADLWAVTEDEYMQPRLQETTEKPAKYDAFWATCTKKGFGKAYARFFQKGNALTRAAWRIKMLFR